VLEEMGEREGGEGDFLVGVVAALVASTPVDSSLQEPSLLSESFPFCSLQESFSSFTSSEGFSTHN
jgi:NAD(P)H-hydrate repair Nnr-like enzyme with NAD(P)H-hydrate dehydratase domain